MRCIFFSLFMSLSFLGQADSYNFPDTYPEVYNIPEVLPLFLHGWHRHEAEVLNIFKSRNIKTVVEVGAWVGNWSVFIGELLPENGKIFAVDHWLGSPEHHNPGSTELALLPKLYQQFLSNVIRKEMTNKVVPVRMDSLSAAKKFRRLKIKADMIYIDAGHDYDSVLKDITAWYPILKSDGIFCGDDWNLDGVPYAVKDYAAAHGLKVCFSGEFWWYEKL